MHTKQNRSHLWRLWQTGEGGGEGGAFFGVHDGQLETNRTHGSNINVRRGGGREGGEMEERWRRDGGGREEDGRRERGRWEEGEGRDEGERREGKSSDGVHRVMQGKRRKKGM